MDHFLSGIDLRSETPANFKEIIFGAGCFWGVERKFWLLDGVWLTSVGYAGGDTINPSYEQVCYEETNHVEVVKVIYDPEVISIDILLKTFWECHDPTQGMRQGNDKSSSLLKCILNFCKSPHQASFLGWLRFIPIPTILLIVFPLISFSTRIPPIFFFA